MDHKLGPMQLGTYSTRDMYAGSNLNLEALGNSVGPLGAP